MRPIFADPKTDFVFKRIFGSEVHKPLLIELLNALDLYDRAKIAEQDARGALSLAERQGLEQGLTKGLAKGLLAVFRARGIAVPDADRERILAETNPERLTRWLEKAEVATSVAEVIAEPG